jgi:iron complex transport system substrate-binding protein
MKAICAGLIAIATCGVLGQPREQVMRIVSTSPSMTEMLFALGLGDRVVGVSQFCRYPPQVTSLPRVGTVLRPDLERIVTLRPDLVVISDKNTEFAIRLTAAQIPFVAVATTSLADVSSAMVRIGAAAGGEAHARTVVADMEQRLDAIRRRSIALGRPKVLLIMGRAADSLTGIVAVGAGSYLNELVTIAGGTNVVASVSTIPYPKLQLESILRMDPDVIVDTIDMGATESDRERRNLLGRALWRRYRTVSAVRTGRIHAAETDALFVPGPRVVDAAEWLAQVIQTPNLKSQVPNPNPGPH